MLKSTLFIGLGGCGCKLIDTALSLNPSLNTLFVNSNKNEVSNLDNFNVGLDNYLICTGNGSGRDREKAKKDISNNRNLIIDYMSKQVNKYTNFVIIFSMNGGYGSGGFYTITKVIYSLAKRYGNEIGITLLPVLSHKRVDIENTLLAYNDIVELKKDGFICNYSFIDNNKINNIKEFNKEVMQTILNAYSLNNIELDINDSRRIHNARGYKVFLELNEEFCDNVEDAIDYSIHNSNFIIPESFKNCTHLGISVSENFNAFNISDEFNIKEFDKADISDENNILVIGGCKEPISTIKAYEECLSKSMDYSIADEEEYIINIPKQEPKFEKFKGIVEEKPKKITKADLRKELDDLF